MNPLYFKKEGIVLDYKTAGVDIDAGNEFVKSIPIANKGFGGMFQVPQGYEEPVLVSGTDGVGTKIDIAQAANDYTSIGIDLVAMCVNDIITCGAKPLYFLDYISTKKIDERLPEIMQGIIKGCEYAGVELIGGETAEHPMYQDKIDLAGFCTGIVEKKKIIDGSAIKPSDVVIGLPSTGLHSNGYSIVNYLARRLKMNIVLGLTCLHLQKSMLLPYKDYYLRWMRYMVWHILQVVVFQRIYLDVYQKD